MFNKNICIIGGAGHVGVPLGIAFSSKGHKVILIDKNKKNINKINNGQMPFLEEGCETLLSKEVKKKRDLHLKGDISVLFFFTSKCICVFFVLEIVTFYHRVIYTDKIDFCFCFLESKVFEENKFR